MDLNFQILDLPLQYTNSTVINNCACLDYDVIRISFDNAGDPPQVDPRSPQAWSQSPCLIMQGACHYLHQSVIDGPGSSTWHRPDTLRKQRLRARECVRNQELQNWETLAGISCECFDVSRETNEITIVIRDVFCSISPLIGDSEKCFKFTSPL